MNINSIISEFAQNELVLSRSSDERSRIDSSLAHLEKVISAKLPITEFVRFGSYTRNTILPRKYDINSDIDLMVVFDTKQGIMAPGTYRKYLSDVLSDSYPNSISKKDFPAVKLILNHIKFDVVPAYYEPSFWNNKTYKIPDSKNGWRVTEPNDINSSLSKKNQYCGGNLLRQVIRLCKHWNASKGYPFESYLMEQQIINHWYLGMDSTYDTFLTTLSSIAGHLPGVKQALNHIDQYKGGWFSTPDYTKQFQWLQKLLPGLE